MTRDARRHDRDDENDEQRGQRQLLRCLPKHELGLSRQDDALAQCLLVNVE